MKRAACLLLLLLPYLVHSQIDTTHFAAQKNHANIRFDAAFATQGLTYPFVQKLLFGGRLEKGEKEQILNKLGDQNDFRFDQHFRFSWRWRLPSRGQLGFSVSQRSFMEATFSKTLFRTIFYGNNISGNDAEQMGSQNLNLLTYSNLALTYRTKPLPLSNHTFCFVDLAAGVRFGHKNTHLVANNLTLQTTELAETLRLTSDLLLHNADNQFVNGYGFNFDAALHFQGAHRSGLWEASLFTQDFGLIFWNKASYSLERSLDFTFEGLEIHNLLGGTDHLVDDFIDTLAAEFLQGAGGRRQMTISPTVVGASAQCLFDLSQQFSAGFSVEARAALFSNFCFRLTAAPLLLRTFGAAAAHLFSFQLPLTYHYIYGFGVGARLGFSGSFSPAKKGARYKVQLELSELGVTNAAGGAAIAFSVAF